MKLIAAFLIATLTASAVSFGHAFGVAPPTTTRHASTRTFLQMATNADTIFEGKPTERAFNLDIRQAVAKSSFFNVNGNPINMNDLLGEPSQSSGVSVVVFLRSLG